MQEPTGSRREPRGRRLGSWIALLALALLAVAWSHGCKKEGPQAQPSDGVRTKVRVGYQPTVFYAYLLVGQEFGLFEAAGITLDLVKIPSANKIYQAYLAGQLDMTGLTATEIVLRGYGKDPGSFVCPLMVELNGSAVQDHLLVLKDSPIRSLADLAGKKVGSHPGTTVPNILRALLRKNGVDPATVDIQELKPELQVEAVLSGAVDAIICMEPTGAQLLGTGKTRVLYDHPFGAVESAFPASFTVLGQEFIRRDPAAAQRLIGAIRASVQRYYQLVETDRERLDQIVSGGLGVSAALAREIAPVQYRLPDEWDPEAFARVASFYVGLDVLDKPVPMDAFKPR